MIKTRIILAIVFLLIFKNSLLADIKILVSIDDTIITNHDIKKEDNYLEILNPNLNQLTTNQRLVLAKNSIINQIVKEKEISKFVSINKENKLVDNYLKNLYSKLGLNSEKEFENVLKKKENYTLSEIKDNPRLSDMVLVNNSRLSVQPVSDSEWSEICRMAEEISVKA